MMISELAPKPHPDTGEPRFCFTLGSTQVPAIAASTEMFLSTNGKLVAAVPVKALLKLNPEGVYTGCRTVGRTRIVEFEKHVERIGILDLTLVVTSAKLVRQKPDCPLDPRFTNPEAVRKECLDSSRVVLEKFIESNSEDEAKITFVVTNNDLHCHAERLAIVPFPGTRIDCIFHRTLRENASAKSTAWALKRTILEEQFYGKYHEVLLIDEDGTVREGLQSNFWVVQQGRLRTDLSDAVLRGTMQAALLALCAEANIPVDPQAPVLAEAGQWEEAFLTSTSRLALPIHNLTRPDGSVLSLPSTARGAELRSLLAQQLQRDSVSVF